MTIKRNRQIIFAGVVITAAAMLILLISLLTAAPAQPVAAQTAPDDGRPRTIEVSGYGSIAAQPDRAIVRLGVQTEADTAAEALTANNERMTAVISATLESGIAAEDIQTQGLRLQPVYAEGPELNSRELTGYRARNIVQVTVMELEQLGMLLDTAVAAGGNTIEGIRFEVGNSAELEAAAREAAMLAAQEKAEQLTELAGAELGPVQTIIERGGTRPPAATFAAEESLAADVPVQPGTQMIEATVQVTWEIR